MMGSGEARSSKLTARADSHRDRNGLTFPASSAEQIATPERSSTRVHGRLTALRSFSLTLSVTKFDPDAGHARRLIQGTYGLTEPRSEPGRAVLIGICRGCCDNG
jgi:hypothetical protein